MRNTLVASIVEFYLNQGVAMTQLGVGQMSSSIRSDPYGESSGGVSPGIRLWQVNLLRVGYLVIGGGLAVVKWPLLFDHEPWGLAEGTKECMLMAMSILALLGLRYPLRMLPILLFEVAWKLIWLGVVALPLWATDNLEGATREQTGAVLWVAIVIAIIPWRYVIGQYVTASGDPWRRSR